ncbi:hypothetical protein [Mesorhizobium sp. 1B3]|uniref:hypothetical protein n=1 Tax=Mesorhizobium sp. 1B3 TaxID=3243599 RepID=UPI003D9688AF
MRVNDNLLFSGVFKGALASLRYVALGSALLGSAPAFAGGLDTAYSNAMMPYVVLKRGTIECGKPAGEHIAYKARMLGILGRIPNVDRVGADREIERAFERETLGSSNPTCSDALLERYQYTLENSAEMALQYLAEEVQSRQRNNW